MYVENIYLCDWLTNVCQMRSRWHNGPPNHGDDDEHTKSIGMFGHIFQFTSDTKSRFLRKSVCALVLRLTRMYQRWKWIYLLFFCCFRWRMWGKLKFTSRKKRQQKMCTHTQSIFYHFHAKSMPEIVFTQFINVLFVCSMLYGFVFRDNDRSRQLSYRCSCAQNCFPTISHIL